MALVIISNPWILKSAPLTDGSKVFNLENREIPGTVVRLLCVDEKNAEALQLALGEGLVAVEVDEVKPASAPKKNLLEQCDPVVLSAAAMLSTGTMDPPPMFRNTLREIPALAEGFTIGDVARAYLAATLMQLTGAVKAA